ncbi:hypothetical protein HU200_011280 [Digitaria exilis]|uniref:Uncharacterized protein n=1 Tax=Digitaria exilis TaxID=1010633 RepID=A0A835KLK4_9POAL|nr:hypothetical protein HU200_011280 [Digitaria exilis]
MGFESDDDEEEEPQPPAGGREAERARVHEAPDRPSSSLGIGIDDDDDAEPEIPSRGLREEEQAARRYEAPDPPSFSVCSDDDVEMTFFALGGGKPPSPRPGASRFRRLRKGPSLHRNQTRRYDFGIEDDDFLRGGQHHEQPRPQAVPHYVSVDEEDDDFFLAGEKLNPDPLPPSTRLKRLQRGPPSKEPKMSMTPEVIGKGALDVGSLEDEIEDFTDDDGPGRG